MTLASLILLGVAAALAVGDWVAVGRGLRRLEYVCKPAVMLALMGMAATLHPALEAQRTWFLVALAMGLVGDVLLMLPSDEFLWGLGAFLVGHLAYIVGFASGAALPLDVLLPVILLIWVVLSAVGFVVARPIVAAVARDQPRLVGPMVAYGAVLTMMVALAIASGSRLALLGATLFWCSDYLIALNRFVRRRSRVVIIVSYHVGQAALALSLTQIG